MSTNCIRCIKNKRTSLIDLLCDECRPIWQRSILLTTCKRTLQIITGTDVEHVVINNESSQTPISLGVFLRNIIDAVEYKP
jgi:hypothetical protein